MIDPPPGEAVYWRLLTTHAVHDVVQAFAVVDLYRRRWVIEQLFRALKTQGFDIEGLFIGEDAPLRRLVMATLIAAIIVQQLVHARDGVQGLAPLRLVTDAFEPGDEALLEACVRCSNRRAVWSERSNESGSYLAIYPSSPSKYWNWSGNAAE